MGVWEIDRYVIPMLCMVAVLVIEYRGFRNRAKEYRELEHFAEFLSNLKNHFFFCKNITESIYRAAEAVPGNLRKRLEKICFRLEDDERGTLLAEEFPGYLKYLRLFYVQCRSAIQYGSGETGTESVFIRNMTELRRDVQNDCYQRAQSMHGFAGMGVVTVLPILFLPLVRSFGNSVMEELKTFYNGTAGGMIEGFFGMLTVGCYIFFYMARQTDRRIWKTEKWITKRSYRGLCAGAGLFLGCVAWYMMRSRPLSQGILAAGCGLVAGAAFVMGCNRYVGYLRRIGKGSEVLSLQAVILLLIEVPNITISKILDVLASCAELFREPLLQCADAYASEDAAALERLGKADGFPAFSQLAGRLLASERIGLQAAFSEIASDRHFFREQMQLDMEQERKKKVANAQIITLLPMMFLLFAYLIVPFLWVSFLQMRDIFYEMEQIRYF